MSLYVIHILLLDGKILCMNYKELLTRTLIKHLCNYLSLERPKTVGLLYKDSRGSLQWLEETKLILDHDIATDNDFISLIFKIRHIPHHICYNKSNIHQLFLLSVRLLKQNWFLSRPEIHSQLVALYILFKYGSELYEPEIVDIISQSNLQIVNPISKENLFNTIVNAYSRYRETLNSIDAYLLKILQLTSRFPVFNSRLFVVADAKSQKFILGINSLGISLFHLDEFHNPFLRCKFVDMENVMSRGVKIIIDVKYQKSSSFSDGLTKPMMHNRIARRKEHDMPHNNDNMKKRSLTPSRINSENEMITFYALSPHQSSCICAEIQTSRNGFKEISSTYKISDLMRNANFTQSLNRWLFERYGKGLRDPEESYDRDGLHMFLEEDLGISLEDREMLFGEVSMYESDIYQRITQLPDNNFELDQKPDYDQLLIEENRLKELLKEKLIQLQESFILEEKITGITPKEVFQYFPNGLQKFQRNSRNSIQVYHQHRGCAASVRNKLITMENDSQRRLNKSASGNVLFSPYTDSPRAVSIGNISRSVADLSNLKNGGSFWKLKPGSTASVRSYDEKKLRIGNKSMSNIFFNESPRSDLDQKTRIGPFIKSRRNNINSVMQPDVVDYSRSNVRSHNSVSEQKGFSMSPRSDVLASRTSLQPRSTNSSPLISHSVLLNRKLYRNHDNN